MSDASPRLISDPGLPFGPGDLVRSNGGRWSMYDSVHRTITVDGEDVLLCLNVEESKENLEYPGPSEHLRVRFIRCEFVLDGRVIWASNPAANWDFMERVA